MGKPEPFHIQTDNPVALTNEEGGIMAPGKSRTSKSVDEHYGCLRRFWILFLDIDTHPVNIKEPTMLTNQIVQRYFRLALTERYQIGDNANKEKESHHCVGRYC